MVTRSLILFACACSSAAPAPTAPEPAPAAEPAPAPAATWIDAVRERAGNAPVMLVATERAIVARTADAVLATAVEGATTGARYDAALELVWFQRDGALWVVDLRQSEPSPVAIVRGLGDTSIVVSGTSSYGGIVREAMYLELAWIETPTLEPEVMIEDFLEEGQLDAARKAEIVGADWLAAHRTRTRSPAPQPREAARATPPADSCEDAEMCGAAQAFGRTGWNLFVAAYSCGDYCYWSCLLTDPATGKVSRPDLVTAPVWLDLADADDTGSCGPYYFDAAETVYAHADQLCTAGSTCRSQPGPILGFLRPGPTVEASP